MFNFRKFFSLTLILFFGLCIISGCGYQIKLIDTNNATSSKSTQGTSSETSKNNSDKPKTLTIKVLDIGQGDAILIRTASQTILIDSGDIPQRDKLMDYLAKEKITVLDKVIITHPHADHLGGIPKVLEKIKVKQIYDSGQISTSNLYKQYLSSVNKNKIPFTIVNSGDTINLDNNVSLMILAPKKPFITGTESDLNNNSVVVKLVFKDFSMLFTGDIESEAEAQLVEKYGGSLKSSVLKSPHHGSRTSSTVSFLKAVNPEAVIISVGADNSYNHPHKGILKRYDDLKIKVYRTDTDKTVTIVSDGNSYTISKDK